MYLCRKPFVLANFVKACKSTFKPKHHERSNPAQRFDKPQNEHLARQKHIHQGIPRDYPRTLQPALLRGFPRRRHLQLHRGDSRGYHAGTTSRHRQIRVCAHTARGTWHDGRHFAGHTQRNIRFYRTLPQRGDAGAGGILLQNACRHLRPQGCSARPHACHRRLGSERHRTAEKTRGEGYKIPLHCGLAAGLGDSEERPPRRADLHHRPRRPSQRPRLHSARSRRRRRQDVPHRKIIRNSELGIRNYKQ